MICEYCKKNHDGSYGSGRFCSSTCSRSFSSMINRLITNQKISKALKGKKQKHIESKYPVHEFTITCPICKKVTIIQTRLNHLKKEKTCSKECLKKLISLKTKGKVGGIRKGSGYGKSGYYKGIYCYSTYELIFLAYNIEHKIPIKRSNKKIYYINNKQVFSYYPDFEIGSTLIEIKGYHNNIVDLKTNATKKLGYEIKVLYYQDLKDMLNFLLDKFQIKSIVMLYDSSKYIFNHNCKNCHKFFKSSKSNSIFCCRRCGGIYQSKILHNKRSQ